MNLTVPSLAAAAVFSLAIGPAVTFADEYQNKQSEAETSMKIMQDDKQDQEQRAQPGINSGGQVIPPDEGEQTGKPGTMFGAPATLPPDDKAPQHEGADKQLKEQESR